MFTFGLAPNLGESRRAARRPLDPQYTEAQQYARDNAEQHVENDDNNAADPPVDNNVNPPAEDNAQEQADANVLNDAQGQAHVEPNHIVAVNPHQQPNRHPDPLEGRHAAQPPAAQPERAADHDAQPQQGPNNAPQSVDDNAAQPASRNVHQPVDTTADQHAENTPRPSARERLKAILRRSCIDPAVYGETYDRNLHDNETIRQRARQDTERAQVLLARQRRQEGHQAQQEDPKDDGDAQVEDAPANAVNTTGLERASRHHPSDSTQGIGHQATPAQSSSRWQRFVRWLTCRSAQHFDDGPSTPPRRRPTIQPEDTDSSDNGEDDPARPESHTYPPADQPPPHQRQPRSPRRHNGPMAPSGLEGSPNAATRRRNAIPTPRSDLFVVSEGEGEEAHGCRDLASLPECCRLAGSRLPVRSSSLTRSQSHQGPHEPATARVDGKKRPKRPSLYPSSIPRPSDPEPTFAPTGAAAAASLFADVLGQSTRPTSDVEPSAALFDADIKPQEFDRLIPLRISEADEIMMHKSYPGIDVSGWLQEISCEESSNVGELRPSSAGAEASGEPYLPALDLVLPLTPTDEKAGILERSTTAQPACSYRDVTTLEKEPQDAQSAVSYTSDITDITTWQAVQRFFPDSLPEFPEPIYLRDQKIWVLSDQDGKLLHRDVIALPRVDTIGGEVTSHLAREDVTEKPLDPKDSAPHVVFNKCESSPFLSTANDDCSPQEPTLYWPSDGLSPTSRSSSPSPTPTPGKPRQLCHQCSVVSYSSSLDDVEPGVFQVQSQYTGAKAPWAGLGQKLSLVQLPSKRRVAAFPAHASFESAESDSTSSSAFSHVNRFSRADELMQSAGNAIKARRGRQS